MKTRLILASVAASVAAITIGGAALKGAAIETNEDVGVSVTDQTDQYIAETGKTTVSSQETSVSDEDFPITEEPAAVLNASCEAVDPVDDRITYTLDVTDTISLNSKTGFKYTGECEDSAVSLKYLEDFFGNDNFLVDEQYKENLVRNVYSGSFSCRVPEDTIACSPVDGKVIGVGYSVPLGLAVAVEFDSDKIFILTNLALDGVNVEVGDTVSANQAIGVCGTSGMVPDGEPQFGLIIMNCK